jgi:hypothetical protein
MNDVIAASAAAGDAVAAPAVRDTDLCRGWAGPEESPGQDPRAASGGLRPRRAGSVAGRHRTGRQPACPTSISRKGRGVVAQSHATLGAGDTEGNMRRSRQPRPGHAHVLLARR